MTNTSYSELLQDTSLELQECFNSDTIDNLFNLIVLKNLINEKNPEYSSSILFHQLTHQQLDTLNNLLKSNSYYETLGEHLNSLLLDKRIKKDSEIYSKAHITRFYWSKIINNKLSVPSLNKLLRISAALRLALSETKDLLATAGYSLNELKNPKGIIVAYCFNEMIYDIYDIDEILLANNQPGIFDPGEED